MLKEYRGTKVYQNSRPNTLKTNYFDTINSVVLRDINRKPTKLRFLNWFIMHWLLRKINIISLGLFL